MGVYGGLMGFNGIYPLVNVNKKTMENHHFIAGKIHYKWPFSFAMLMENPPFYSWVNQLFRLGHFQ